MVKLLIHAYACLEISKVDFTVWELNIARVCIYRKLIVNINQDPSVKPLSMCSDKSFYSHINVQTHSISQQRELLRGS